MRSRFGLRLAPVLLLAAIVTPAAEGQERGFSAACGAVDESLQSTCFVAAQAVAAAQPQVGILLTGGNPTIGDASGGGLRLGILPRVSATVKATLVDAEFPDLREVRSGAAGGASYGDVSIVAPSLTGTVSVSLFPGISAAPTIAGIGSLDLLGTASWLPLRALGSDEFRSGTAELAYGSGVRIGLLRESFTIPGVSVALMYHGMGTVSYGDVCPHGLAVATGEGSGYTLEEGECLPFGEGSLDRGDMGEFEFDLGSWSTHAVVGKRLAGLGLAAGVGYTRFSSDVSAAVRAPQGDLPEPRNAYAAVRAVDLSQGRFSGFVNGSYSLLVAAISAEVGWMQGADAVTGYPGQSSDFDPGDGTFFGSVALRVAL